MKAYIHPAILPIDQLVEQCTFQRTRRSGPGGQHRNKVESAVIVTHEPSSIQAEANERRSQHENRSIAIKRLRLQLAIHLRSQSPNSFPDDWEPSKLWSLRVRNKKIAIRADHDEFPAILAEALNVLQWHNGRLADAAATLAMSTSQLARLIKLDSLVWQAVNRLREKKNWPPIK